MLAWAVDGAQKLDLLLLFRVKGRGWRHCQSTPEIPALLVTFLKEIGKLRSDKGQKSCLSSVFAHGCHPQVPSNTSGLVVQEQTKALTIIWRLLKLDLGPQTIYPEELHSLVLRVDPRISEAE